MNCFSSENFKASSHRNHNNHNHDNDNDNDNNFIMLSTVVLSIMRQIYVVFFHLFLVMVMYANEFKAKEKQ